MIQSNEERAARKKAQLARIALKGTPGYSKAYESQPEQIRLRAKQDAERAAQRAAKKDAAVQAARDAQEAAAIFEQAASLSTVGGE